MTTTNFNKEQLINVPVTKSTFVAGENITAGNALYVSGSNVFKTDASSTSKINFIGFASANAPLGGNVIVDTSGVSNTQSSLSAGLDYYLASNITSGGNITQSTRNTTVDFGRAGAGLVKKVGQTFTTTSTEHILQNVKVYLSKSGTPTDDLVIRIYQTSPSGTFIASSSNYINGTTLTGTATEYTFNFNNIILLPNTSYAFEIDRLGGGYNDTNYYQIEFSTLNPYANGEYWFNDGSWSNNSSYDLKFIINFGQYYGTGIIGTTPGFNVRRIGKAISTTAIELETSANNSLEGTLGTTATTGSVTLGNAVGYVTVKINGVDRKVPYYS